MNKPTNIHTGLQQFQESTGAFDEVSKTLWRCCKPEMLAGAEGELARLRQLYDEAIMALNAEVLFKQRRFTKEHVCEILMPFLQYAKSPHDEAKRIIANWMQTE